MKNSLLLSVAATALLALAASPALAGTITVIGVGDFDSPTVVDFDNLGQNEDASNASSSVTFVGVFGDKLFSPAFAAPGAATAANFVDGGQQINPFSFSFDGFSVNRVGWQAGTNAGDVVTVSLFQGLTSLGSLDFTTPTGSGGSVSFIGLESDMLFDRVSVAIAGQTGAHLMNDLQFDVVAVPLPPAAYMGLGLLAGLAVLRRRRRQLAAI